MPPFRPDSVPPLRRPRVALDVAIRPAPARREARGQRRRILFTTEGTYPSAMGGVSTWCDQLVRGLPEQDIHLVEVTGPLPTTPAFELPDNVVDVSTIHLWRPPRGSPHRVGRRDVATFELGFERLLTFADKDLDGFATGVRTLARLGSRVDLAPWFERPAVWRTVTKAMRRLLGEPPPLAEVALAVNWMRATLAPLLYLPPAADQAHTTSNGLSAIPAWIAAREQGIPLMLTEHGLYLRERYLGLGSEDNPPGLKLLRARFFRTLAQLVYRDADLIVSVSEFNRAWQVELGAPIERTRVVYNGVDPALFPHGGATPQARPTVSWVGRIDPLKDLDTLVRSFARVVEALPNACLRLYGPVPSGNEAYNDRIVALIRKLGLQENVSFEGSVSPIHDAYHAADVVALSSVSEGFPYVAIEAMMCGRPVVATRVGGVSEAVGTYGRVVDPRNPADFGAALVELLRDAPLRRELGAHARERALALFTLERMRDGYRRLYAELAGEDDTVDRDPVEHDEAAREIEVSAA